MPTVQYSLPRWTKKFYSIHREGIRVYSGTFRTSPAEACDGTKKYGKKVGFAAVSTDISRRGDLPEEASIHTAEMTAINVVLKEVHKREDNG